MKKYFETNKILWDSRTKVHIASEFYEMDAFLRGKNSLKEIELELLISMEKDYYTGSALLKLFNNVKSQLLNSNSFILDNTGSKHNIKNIKLK